MEKTFQRIFCLAIFLLFGQQVYPQNQEADSLLSKYSSGIITIIAWDANKTVVGEGTGFAIGENQVVVPYHLISQAAEAEISTISSKKARVESIIALYKSFDLALLRIKGKVDPIPLGKSDQINSDSRLFAMTEIAGRIVISEGKLKDWLELSPPRVRILDVTMSLEKPACGAPIFDDSGKVVGMALVFGPGVKFGVPIEPVLDMNRLAKGVELKAAVKENYQDSPEGAFLIGKGAALLNEPGMATVYLEKYIKSKPEDLEAYILLGKAYFRLANNSESYKNYARALLLEPNHPEALYGLGLNLLKEQKYKEATEQLEKAIANGVKAKEIYFELGTAYEELQDLGRAAENYQKYVASAPPNPWSGWLKLAQTYVKLNQPEKAISAYQEALKINPNDINCNYNLAKLLAETKRYEEAEAVFKKLAEINKRDEMTYYGQILQMYDRAEKYDQAIEAAQKIVELNPKNEMAIYNLAIMYFKLNRLEEAVKTLNDCLAIKDNYTYAWFNLGLVYSKMNKHQEAVEAFKKYNALAPDDPLGWLNVGLEYMFLKDFERALPFLEKSVQLKPNDAAAQYNLAITYINLNDNYSAREVLKILQRLDPALANRLSKLIK